MQLEWKLAKNYEEGVINQRLKTAKEFFYLLSKNTYDEEDTSKYHLTIIFLRKKLKLNWYFGTKIANNEKRFLLSKKIVSYWRCYATLTIVCRPAKSR